MKRHDWFQTAFALEGLCCLGNAKVVLDQTARDMPEVGAKMWAGRLFQGSIPAEGFALTAGKRARPGLQQLKRMVAQRASASLPV